MKVGIEVCGMTNPNHSVGVDHAIEVGAVVGDKIWVEVGFEVKVGVDGVIEVGIFRV